MVGGLSLMVATPRLAIAASCGAGVETSIIDCDETGGDEGVCPDGTRQAVSNACADGSTPDAVKNSPIWGVLLIAINILTAGVGIAAVAGTIYGAILYTSAGGSTEQVKKAYGIFTNIVIGIIAYALMYAGLNFLIPGGLFA